MRHTKSRLSDERVPVRRSSRTLSSVVTILLAVSGLAVAGGTAALPAAAAQPAQAAQGAPSVTPAAARPEGTSAAATFTKTGTSTATGTSTDSAAGTTGTTQQSDTLNWVLHYTNTTGSSATVDQTDAITGLQGYVPGSLKTPPSLSPQYTTDGGQTWTAGSPPSGTAVNGVGATGTVPASITSSASSNFSAAAVTFNTPGGDGYSVEGYLGNVYTVFHHNSSPTVVFCATLSGAICPGWPAQSSYVDPTPGTPLGTGSSTTYFSDLVNGSFISGGRLYWPASQNVVPANPFGMQCLDLNSLTSCGFTALGSTTVPGYSLSGDGIAAGDGNYYYVDLNGDLQCVSPAGASCGTTTVTAGQPMGTVGNPEIDTFGQYVYISYVDASNSTEFLSCYDTTAHAVCPAFPIAVGAPSPHGSEVFPVVSSTGTILGGCAVFDSACFTPTGAPLPNPWSQTAYAFSPTTNDGFGTGVLVGTKYYTANGNVDSCYDFSIPLVGGEVQPCAQFTTAPTNVRGYTVRALQNLPGCMASNGDGAQITIFNALTGGPCTTASQQVTLSPEQYYCDGQSGHVSSWQTVSLPGLTGTEYESATVTLQDANGNPVAGFDNIPFPTGTPPSIDISSIPTSGATASLTAVLNLAGVTDSAAVDASHVQLSWSGDPIQTCYSTTVLNTCPQPGTTVTNTANAVTTGDNGVTDAPAGTSSGQAAFDFVPTAACAAISIDKHASPPVDVNGDGLTDAGDTIQYTFTVTNTGVLTLSSVGVNDPKAGTVTCPQTTLAPAASELCTATSVYTITAADVTAGTVHNSATAEGTPPGAVTPVVSLPSTTDTPTAAPAPALSLVKSADPSDAAAYTPGQLITYHFVVTNTGNVPMNGISVDESQFSGTGTMSPATCPSPTLALGEQEVCTATYTLTQADVDAGSLTNTAVANGTPTGSNVSVPSGPSSVTIPQTPAPGISLVKSVDSATVNAAGEQVTYAFFVTNTGNVTLTNPTVTETQFSGTGALSAIDCPQTSLVAGQFETCTATYTVTQADMDAGTITNTATVTGTPPTGAPVTSVPSNAVVNAAQAPELTLVKTASAQAAQVGQQLTYSFAITNTGNLTITGPTVTEAAFSGTGQLSAITCPPGVVLLPTDTTTCSATYTVTQADIDSGKITNTATAAGTSPGGATVTSQPSSVAVVTSPHPALALVKTASIQQATQVGQVVNYLFAITNAGNVDITNPNVAEGSFSGHGSLSAVTCPGPSILPPGQTIDCTATYTVVAADLAAGGTLTNTATATGTTAGGDPIVSDPSTAKVTEVAPAGLASTGSDLLPPFLIALGLLVLGLVAALVTRYRRRGRTD